MSEKNPISDKHINLLKNVKEQQSFIEGVTRTCYENFLNTRYGAELLRYYKPEGETIVFRCVSNYYKIPGSPKKCYDILKAMGWHHEIDYNHCAQCHRACLAAYDKKELEKKK